MNLELTTKNTETTKVYSYTEHMAVNLNNSSLDSLGSKGECQGYPIGEPK